MTFAPEVGQNRELIGRCRQNGIIPALGHTSAAAEAVHAFAGQGLVHATHLMNGMKSLHHREPGPVAAALTDDRITTEIIADGHHLHPEIVRLIHRQKPPTKRVLVTDAVFLDLPGAQPGEPDMPNLLPGGQLAGSRLRLCRAVRNYLEFTGCPLAEAVNMASLNPARVLGEGASRGSIAAGKRADLVIARDDLEPETVIVGGEIVFPL
jgi:N-acetylglucosamine-6-phosphate deacetylase